MAERTLTAMYDTRGAAEAARDQLVALGIPSAGVTIRGTDAGTTATSAPAADEDKGFWASLADLFAPEEDQYTYAEGLRRGGYLLSARVPDGMADRASDVLEQSGAVDIDERAEGWRQGGWTGYQAGATGSSGSAAAGMTSTARAGGAADTAGYASSAGTAGTSAAGLGAAGSATTRDVAEGGVVERAEEQVRVGKREVGGGRVRVRSYVVERPVEEQVNLRQERVEVERRPVDRPVEPGDACSGRRRSRPASAARRRSSPSRRGWSRRSASARTSRPAPRRCATRSASRRSRSRTIGPTAGPASSGRSVPSGPTSGSRRSATARAASLQPRGRPPCRPRAGKNS